MKMKFSPNDAYAEATGTIRMLEKKLLTEADIDRVVDSSTITETLRLLGQSTDYAIDENILAKDLESILQNELNLTYQTVQELCPESYIIDIVRQKYLFHNRKVEVKNRFLDKKEVLIKVEDIPDFSKDIDEDIVDPQEIDMFYDKQMYEVIANICKELNNQFIIEYYKMKTDFYNIRLMLRAKSMNKPLSLTQDFIIQGGKAPRALYLELYDAPQQVIKEKFFYQYFGKEVIHGLDTFETTKNYGLLEKELDNLLMNKVKSSKYIAFGPEIAFAYLLAKENEVNQIRLIVNCKVNDIPNDLIRERLRDSYA